LATNMSAITAGNCGTRSITRQAPGRCRFCVEQHLLAAIPTPAARARVRQRLCVAVILCGMLVPAVDQYIEKIKIPHGESTYERIFASTVAIGLLVAIGITVRAVRNGIGR